MPAVSAAKKTWRVQDPPWHHVRIASSRFHPRRAASILATSILRIVIIASKARLATAGSGSV